VIGRGQPRRFRSRWLPWTVLACALLAPAGWIASDVLERSNDFCNACHLDANTRLHIDIRNDYDDRPPQSLAAAHAGAEAGSVLCIDCHGGVGLVGRARVKALAAKDAFFWITGRFEEPQQMSHPLWDADCLRCHPAFDTSPSEFGPRRFHELGVHNAGLDIDCVDCHSSHEPGGAGDYFFLRVALVRERCAACHIEFANTSIE
jgi:hypothetical protein